MLALTRTLLLLCSLAQLEPRNVYGNTPLHVACHNGQDIIVNDLLAYGAEINATNNKGQVRLAMLDHV